MHTTRLRIAPDAPFDFTSTVHDHGWVDLAPNKPLPQGSGFSRAEVLPSDQPVDLQVTAEGEAPHQALIVAVVSRHALAKADQDTIKSTVSRMLRLDEDLSEFHALCQRAGAPWQRLAAGRGRLLRSPTLFEDLVKVICTTNIQWGGTRRMLAELVNAFGTHVSLQQGERTFPDARSLAALDEADFSSRVRLGYRGKFVLGLAKDLAEGRLDAGRWLDPHMPTGEIKKQLLAIKGIGSYAAASMLMLLGRYEDIPVDTVFRAFMAEKYFQGKEFDLESALSVYAGWGKWKYLAYWFEMIEA